MYGLILFGFLLGLTWAELTRPESGRKNTVSRPGAFANWTKDTRTTPTTTVHVPFCLTTLPTYICLTSPPGNTNILCLDLDCPPRSGLIAILACGCGFPDGTGGDAVLNPDVYQDCSIISLEDEDPDSVFCIGQCIFCNEQALICTQGELAICLCFCGVPFIQNGTQRPMSNNTH